MSSYSIYNKKGFLVADITKRAGDEMITTKDGYWDYDSKGRRWLFECDLAYTAAFQQVRIYIYAGYYMRPVD